MAKFSLAHLAQTPLHPSWSNSPVADWLADHQGQTLAPTDLLTELCERLIESGAPLLRVVCGIPAMHPQYLGSSITWVRGQGAEEIRREHSIQDSPAYHESPIAMIHQGAAAIRRRLEGPAPQLDFPVLQEVKALGATDYLAVALHFTRGRPSFVSWATDKPGGFTVSQLALLSDLLPLMALRFELAAAYQMTQDLLTTYLGTGAAGQVLAGTVRRGQGAQIHAAIWYSDLRGFTAMSDRMGAHDVITTLGDYFECLARPVQEHGGEVLKFIGDGMLAIFRADPENPSRACHTALDAAIDAFDRLHLLNQGRAMAGGNPLRIGVALHLGDVIYGNIGAQDRLDFTVIGRAVNEVVRVEAACKVLGRPLLTSAAFAGCNQKYKLDALGFHALRGVKEPQELFGLPPAALPGSVPE